MIKYAQILISFWSILILSSCSTIQSAQKSELAHLYNYRWSLPAAPEQTITTEQAAKKLKNYDVVFFGELHGHPGIHLAQMELFAQLYQLNRNISLSMEQFERDTQPVLDQYLNREIGEGYLVENARAWDNYQSAYRPLVEFARDRKLPVIAANAPKQMVVCVGASGLDVLDRYPEAQRNHVAQHIDVSDGPYRQKFIDFMQQESAHQTVSDDSEKQIMQTMVQRSYAAQAVRDDTMAESIARHLENNPGRQVLHLNGNFHSSGFLGTVERLQQRMPLLNIAVIHAMTDQGDDKGVSSKAPGTLLIEVQSIPDKFVDAKHREQWLLKTMKKRMESRKRCPD